MAACCKARHHPAAPPRTVTCVAGRMGRAAGLGSRWSTAGVAIDGAAVARSLSADCVWVCVCVTLRVPRATVRERGQQVDAAATHGKLPVSAMHDQTCMRAVLHSCCATAALPAGYRDPLAAVRGDSAWRLGCFASACRRPSRRRRRSRCACDWPRCARGVLLIAALHVAREAATMCAALRTPPFFRRSSHAAPAAPRSVRASPRSMIGPDTHVHQSR